MDRPAEEIIHQARYLSQELADAGRENVEFLLEKLKTATDQYKLLRAHLLRLEDRVQSLVRRVRIQEEGTATNAKDGSDLVSESAPSLFGETDPPASEPPVEASAPSTGTDSGNIKSTALEIKPESHPETEDSPEDAPPPSVSSPDRLFIQGQNLFIERSWDKAISSLEKYRKTYPKGSHYPSATYLIARSFQELDMKEEAQIFFKELVADYPNSPAGKKAVRFTGP